MNLQVLWFVLICVLFAGFFFLEGFDYGVGILLPFLGKTDDERRMVIRSIGPFWDGNEVWMLTAGGALFAAFPNWYATMFSGFYLALVLLLVALIVRGVGFEFRNRDPRPGWRRTWDGLIFFGSAVPALLWGVALSDLIRGVPVDAQMNYVGTFWDLLSPFALLGGLTTLSAFTLYGAIFLALKTGEPIAERAHKAALRLWLPVTVIAGAFFISGYFQPSLFGRLGSDPGVGPVVAGGALLAVGWLVRERYHGWAFVMMGTVIVLSTATFFATLFPRVMVSSLNPAYSLTIYNASSSPYTLTVMTIIAAVFVPIVLLYQAWNYYVFRQRVMPAKSTGAQEPKPTAARGEGAS